MLTRRTRESSGTCRWRRERGPGRDHVCGYAMAPATSLGALNSGLVALRHLCLACGTFACPAAPLLALRQPGCFRDHRSLLIIFEGCCAVSAGVFLSRSPGAGHSAVAGADYRGLRRRDTCVGAFCRHESIDFLDICMTNATQNGKRSKSSQTS